MAGTHDTGAYDNQPTTLRDQIGLAVIAAHKTFDDSNGWSWADYGGHIADAVMEVLPEQPKARRRWFALAHYGKPVAS